MADTPQSHHHRQPDYRSNLGLARRIVGLFGPSRRRRIQLTANATLIQWTAGVCRYDNEHYPRELQVLSDTWTSTRSG